MRVVTYQTTRGETIDICPDCERRLLAAREWPRNAVGDEYCQVYYGLHQSEAGCDICGTEAKKDPTRGARR